MNLDYSATPESYAQKLASYISNPSTVRVRTLEYFGRAPTVERCAFFINAQRKPVPQHEDENFIPSMLAKWSCGHEVNSDNAYLKPTGDYGCIICRRAMQREASRLYREKKALEAARLAEEQAAAEENARRIAQIKRERSLRKVTRQEARTSNRKLRASYVEEVMRNCTLAVSKASGLTIVQLVEKNRRPEVVVCRAAVFTLAREYNLSFPEIGRWAKRDHSSVLHLVRGGFTALDRCPGLFDRVINKARRLMDGVERMAA